MFLFKIHTIIKPHGTSMPYIDTTKIVTLIRITRDSLHYVTSPLLDITNYESKVHSTKSIVLNQIGVCI